MAGSLLALLVLRASPAGAWLSRPSSSGSHRGPAPSSLSLCDKYDAMLVSFISTHRPDTAQLFCKITAGVAHSREPHVRQARAGSRQGSTPSVSHWQNATLNLSHPMHQHYGQLCQQERCVWLMLASGHKQRRQTEYANKYTEQGLHPDSMPRAQC